LGGAGPKFPTTDQQPQNAVGRHQLTNKPRFLTGPHIIGTAGLSSKNKIEFFFRRSWLFRRKLLLEGVAHEEATIRDGREA
jgi:hypothetical protein